LEQAISAVSEGKTYLSSSIARLVEKRKMVLDNSHQSPLEQLTPRQREILQLIAEGKSTKEIAHVLNVSAKTVETHRALLMDRLGIRDVPGLVRYAIRIGLVQPEP
jgi:DNA-binding NarL/FixJ family response regulator